MKTLYFFKINSKMIKLKIFIVEIIEKNIKINNYKIIKYIVKIVLIVYKTIFNKKAEIKNCKYLIVVIKHNKNVNLF